MLSSVAGKQLHGESDHLLASSSARDLYEATRDGLIAARNREKPKGPASVGRNSLYYYRNDINDMEIDEKNCYHIFDPERWDELIGKQFADPDAPLLDLPEHRLFENDIYHHGMSVDRCENELLALERKRQNNYTARTILEENGTVEQAGLVIRFHD